MTGRSLGDTEGAARVALSSFGIFDARLEPLTGGLLNRVFRVESGGGVLVLKEYDSDALRVLDPQQVCDAQETARAHGLPVSALLPTVDGRAYALAAGSAFILAEFIQGRTYGVDAMPERAAYRTGVMLARLQDALADLPPGEAPPLWPLERIRDYLEGLLAFADARSDIDPVDERASALLRQKLTLLETLGEAPTYEPGWTHGDYHWRNVLFDGDDEVAGIIDFDTVAYYSPARDVMRCIALSFPSLGPSAFAFFEGYATARGLAPEEAQRHVAFYRYISSYRVWPAAHRYLEPDTYDPRWDDLIQPSPDWDWSMLSDRFSEIASRAVSKGESRL